MNARSMRLDVLFYVLALLAGSAGSAGAQEKSVEERCDEQVALARDHTTGARPEAAARCLRQALRLAEEITPAAKGLVAKNKILASMRKVDPRWKERAALAAEVSSELVALAERQRKRAWNECAHELLAMANELDSKAAAEPLAALAKAGFKSKPTSTHAPTMKEWFADATRPYMNRAKWKIEDDAVFSPALTGPQDGKSSAMLMPSRIPLAEEYYIDIEARLPKQGEFGLLFGAKEAASGMFCFVRREVDGQGVDTGQLYVAFEELGQAGFTSFERRYEYLSRREREGLIRLRVEVRKSGTRARVFDLPWIHAKDAKLTQKGRIALFVPGNSDCRESLEFRALKVGDLSGQ